MTRAYVMLMVLVAGVLVVLAISLSVPPPVEGDDAKLHRLCEQIRHDDPDWWEKHCKI